MICVETRHMRAVLKAQINKTDRNDARGIAQMMRAGLYRPVHVKTLRSQKLRMLLTHRKLLQSKAIAVENDLRGTLRNFGLKVGVVGTGKFEARIKELVEDVPDLAVLVEPLLVVRRVLRKQNSVLHRRLLAMVQKGGTGLGLAIAFKSGLASEVRCIAKIRETHAFRRSLAHIAERHSRSQISPAGRCCGWQSHLVASAGQPPSASGRNASSPRIVATGFTRSHSPVDSAGVLTWTR